MGGRGRGPAIFATLGVVFFCGLGAIFYMLVSAPPKPPGPPLYPEPPLYPGVAEATVVKGFSSIEPISGMQLERMIRFTASDSPQAVLAFYESTLTQAGWSLFAKVNPNERNFFWSDGSIATGLYKTNVTVTPLKAGGTDVTLETGIDIGGDNR